jgi:hypothetical protein
MAVVLESDASPKLSPLSLQSKTFGSSVGGEAAGDEVAGDEAAGDEVAGDAVAGDGLVGDRLVGDGLAGDGLAGGGVTTPPGAGGAEVVGEKEEKEGPPVAAGVGWTVFTVALFGASVEPF